MVIKHFVSSWSDIEHRNEGLISKRFHTEPDKLAVIAVKKISVSSIPYDVDANLEQKGMVGKLKKNILSTRTCVSGTICACI